MKIGELQEHCGNCPLIDYCTEPYETPRLCGVNSLSNVDTNTYRSLADEITNDEIQDKLYQYNKNGTEWTDENIGAVCDLILEKLN